MNISEITDDDRQQVIELRDRCGSARATNDAHAYIAAVHKHSASSILIGKKNGDVIAVGNVVRQVSMQMQLTNLVAIGFYDKLGYRFHDMVVLGKHF